MEAIKFNLKNMTLQKSNFKANSISNNSIGHKNSIKDRCSFSGKAEAIMSSKAIADALTEHIAKNSKPAPEFVKEIASKSQVLMLGENHGHFSAKKFAVSVLSSLKGLGYTDIAVEVPSKFQKYVDLFISGKLSIEDLLKLTFIKLKNNLNSNHIIEGCSPEMIQECKKLELNVNCIDSRDEFYLNKMFDSELMSSDNKLRTFFLSKERKMFANLNNKIFKQRPDAKVMIYIGQGHILKSPTKGIPKKRLREFISNSGQKVNSLSIVEPMNVNDFVNTLRIKTNIGFSTTDKLIADFPYASGGMPHITKPCEYYDKHLDGMIVID